MIAALFVEKHGSYAGLPGVEVWDIERDARKYQGPWPVVAHPPCERWGRYWSGGPSAKVRRQLGDDGGCFAAALLAVRTWGGILEHPEASHAFREFGLGSPWPGGGWDASGDGQGVICQVEQGHYGHAARKKTWLYAVGPNEFVELVPELKWGPCEGRQRLDEGFHSKEERRAARAAGIKPRKRLSKRECAATPPAFRDVLIQIAKGAR